MGQRESLHGVIFAALSRNSLYVTQCNMNQTLASRLKEARIARGYRTAKQFSDTHGFKQSTYSTHEKGTRVPLREIILAYSAALNVSIDWLLTGNGAGPNGKEKEIVKDKLLEPQQSEEKFDEIVNRLNDDQRYAAALLLAKIFPRNS